MFGDHRRIVASTRLECGDDFRCRVGVAESNRNISYPALKADSSDGTAFHFLKPGFFAPQKKIGEFCSVQTMARCEIVLCCQFRKFVPGTKQLAVIAAVNSVAKVLSKFDRNRAFVFDRQIGNASPRVQRVGCDDRFGGADIDTGRAGASMRFFHRVNRQRQIGV